MTFPPKLLYNDEEVVIDMHPHWWTLVPSGSGLVASMILGGLALGIEQQGRWWVTALRYAAGLLVVVFLVMFITRLIQRQSRNFVVTTERCIYRSGVFAKQGIEIPLDRINTVFFNQSVFERLIKAGDIGIESAGEGSRQEFNDILDPSHVQNEIYRQMEAYENRRQDRLGQVVSGAHQAAAPQPPTIPDQIAQLAALRDQGHLTPAEFEAKKAELLGRM